MKYSPRHKRETNRWDFTIKTEGEVSRPFGYCMEFWNKGNHEGHHARPEEAVECFIRFMVEQGLDYKGVLIAMQKCEYCGEKTFSCAMHEGQLFMSMCRDHCKPEFVIAVIRKKVSFEVAIPELAEDPTDIVPESKIDVIGELNEAVRSRNKHR